MLRQLSQQYQRNQTFNDCWCLKLVLITRMTNSFPCLSSHLFGIVSTAICIWEILSTVLLGTIYWPSFSQDSDIFIVMAIVYISFFGSFIICTCFVIVNVQKHKYWVILKKYLVLFDIVLSVICIQWIITWINQIIC